MPIPFILGAAAVYMAGKGISKGLDAKDKMDETKEIVKQIERIVNRNSKLLEERKKEVKGDLESLGRTKLSIMADSMKCFVDEYRKLKNVNFKDININELEDFEPEDASIKDLSVAAVDASRIAVNGMEAVGSGALISAATYGSVMYGGFAAASTGTMIGSLHGVAATNATLAWLGGGALKAGGFGMLGGSIVLGGLVAGPALLLGGWWLDSEAEDKLYEAKNKKDEALKYQAEVEKIVTGLVAISDRSFQIQNLLGKLNKIFEVQVVSLMEVIESFGINYSKYDVKSKMIVGNCCLLAKAIKLILDAPLFTEKGELTTESGLVIETFNNSNLENVKELQQGIKVVDDTNGTILAITNMDFKKIMDGKQVTEVEKQKAKELYILGWNYQKGIGVEKDYSKALYYYKQAADMGNGDAYAGIGYAFANDLGIGKNTEKAIDFYKQGAKLGSARAMNNLGSAYNCGLGVQKNPCEAVVWFEKAASLNYELGIMNLADCYYNGEGVSRDYSKALVLYKKAAELGNSGAMNRIGFCYDQGLGVEKDLREAFVWFKKSADLGNSAAMGNVGLCYEYGDGVEVNYKKAAEWYEKAIAAGYEKAKKSLERVKKLM